MSYTPYEVLALVEPDVDWGFSDVIAAIRASYDALKAPVQIKATEKRCELYFGDWAFHIYWETAAHVILESQEMSRKFPAKDLDPSVIASCACRITTAGDSDPDMEHINEYFHVLEVLKGFEGVFLFDPYEGKFMTRLKPQ